jgi:hypothetical protein
MIVTWHAATYISKSTCEIEATTGVKLADLIAIYFLPWRVVGRWGFPCRCNASVPFGRFHQRIDASSLEVDANSITGSQF